MLKDKRHLEGACRSYQNLFEPFLISSGLCSDRNDTFQHYNGNIIVKSCEMHLFRWKRLFRKRYHIGQPDISGLLNLNWSTNYVILLLIRQKQYIFHQWSKSWMLWSMIRRLMAYRAFCNHFPKSAILAPPRIELILNN